MAFAEIVRDNLINKCMFNLVSSELRNFILDQLLVTSPEQRTLTQLVFILAHTICISLAIPQSKDLV